MMSVASTMEQLEADPWRIEHPFSPDLGPQLGVICNEGATRDERIEALNAWLSRYQPCLFGRIAAKTNAITYCLLTEKDLRGSDQDLAKAIQAARLEWLRRGYRGDSS